jgi:hypothetical protein
VDARLLLWTGKASQIIGDLVDGVIPTLSRTDKDHADWIVRQLFMMAHTSSEGLLLLVRVERAWGSEMIVRSVAEATAKLAFIELADEALRSDRAKDFWEVGLDLTSLADDRRIREFFASFPAARDEEKWRPYRELVLSDERRTELESRYPNKFRHDHDSRWSFRALYRALGEEGHKLFGDFARGPYWYSISSHILHADAFAVAASWDRFGNRTEAQRLALELAHGARLVSDVLILAYMRLYAISRRRQIPRADVKAWWKQCTNLMDAMGVAHEEFRGAVYGDNNGGSDVEVPSE